MDWDSVCEKAIAYFEDNDNEFIETIETLDNWNGYLDGKRFEPMDTFNDFFYGTRDILGDIIDRLNPSFTSADDYWYWDDWGEINSTDEIDYSDFLDDDFIEDLYNNRGDVDMPSYIEKLFDAYDNIDDEDEEEEEDEDFDEEDENEDKE